MTGAVQSQSDNRLVPLPGVSMIGAHVAGVRLGTESGGDYSAVKASNREIDMPGPEKLRDLQAITVTVLDTAGGALPSSKGGGPEICIGPNDIDGGEAGPPQVLPGMFDKTASPSVLDDLGDMRQAADFFPPQDWSVAPSMRLSDAIPLEPPPLTAWDDGFS